MPGDMPGFDRPINRRITGIVNRVLEVSVNSSVIDFSNGSARYFGLIFSRQLAVWPARMIFGAVS